ncbi:MAG: alpha/beta hydrolase [Pseudomonas sp.]|nr:alpha/beta hydrolase [Pseudomonas sp.]
MTLEVLLKRGLLVMVTAAITLLAWRAYDSEKGPPLASWHTFVPDEMSVTQLDRANWAGWLAAEANAFDEVREHVSADLPEHTPRINRYRSDSPVYPAHFTQDWNRSYELFPDGPPKGVVVLLHGLTDSPYSLRHIAQRYRDLGYLAVGLRLPGHGTVPGALTRVQWQDWLAATRLAVREARLRVPAPAPLHIVGFSTGGALAVKYALDSLADPSLARADQLVLLSPMIGVAGSARFAGIAGWPAILPAFAKAAWLSRLPEFNPFKYNSFPVNAARQSWLLTDVLQRQLSAKGARGLPPILAFQSLADYTVSTPAVINNLFNRLPANGSELVLYDLNRAADYEGLLDEDGALSIEHLLPATPRNYRTTVISNASTHDSTMNIKDIPAQSTHELTQPLGLAYPADIFSLSHIALPFPVTDGLYGQQPSPAEHFGVHLGTLAARGERGVLVVPLDALMRLTANPFYPYQLHRIEAHLPTP